ncbi:hypothetical protein LR48_Vigan07g200400 [Vigna angularis]|uniref:Uncharacterized protein n=1 Tax=Phaseolus angularis TaxID=3914 RepID=A0A0L9UZK1_PHAAN|nr:hypothetical protein LR48_Vigan07g200400 [Vigna angularis]
MPLLPQVNINPRQYTHTYYPSHSSSSSLSLTLRSQSHHSAAPLLCFHGTLLILPLLLSRSNLLLTVPLLLYSLSLKSQSHHSAAPPLRRHHSVAPPSPHLLQRLRKPWLHPTPQPQPVTPPTPQPQPHHQSPPNRTRSHSTNGRDLRSSVVRGPPGAARASGGAVGLAPSPAPFRALNHRG